MDEKKWVNKLLEVGRGGYFMSTVVDQKSPVHMVSVSQGGGWSEHYARTQDNHRTDIRKCYV